MIFGLFKSELLIFWEHKSKWVIHSKNKAICSFINLCDLLTFAHLSWATWANCSHFLICPEQFEQMSEWVNSHPSTSVPLSLLYLCTSVPLSVPCTLEQCTLVTVYHYTWVHLSLWYPSSSVPLSLVYHGTSVSLSLMYCASATKYLYPFYASAPQYFCTFWISVPRYLCTFCNSGALQRPVPILDPVVMVCAYSRAIPKSQIFNSWYWNAKTQLLFVVIWPNSNKGGADTACGNIAVLHYWGFTLMKEAKNIYHS